MTDIVLIFCRQRAKLDLEQNVSSGLKVTIYIYKMNSMFTFFYGLHKYDKLYITWMVTSLK